MAQRVVEPTLRVRAAAALVAISAVVALVLVTVGDLVDDEPTGLVVTGQAVVPRGQAADAVFVVRGTARVEGTVEHDVVVLDGTARITGTVSGDVTVLHGRAVLGREAVIGGDLSTSAPSRVPERATIGGTVDDLGPLDTLGALPRSLWFGGLVAVAWALLGVLLVVPGPVRIASDRLVRHPLRSLLTGAAALLLLPLVGGIYLLSLLGAGLGLLLGAAAAVGVALGAAAVADAVGRLVLPGSGRPPALVGWAALLLVFGVALLVSPLLVLVLAVPVAAAGLGALLPSPERDRSDPPAPEDDRPDDVDPLDQLADLDPPSEDDGPRVLAALPLD